MYAVVKTGGKQYRVQEGDILRVEKLHGEIGDTMTLDEVMMLGGDNGVTLGKPLVSGASVSAQITRQALAKKIIVFKMKRRKNYRRKYGHRQPYTELKVTGISA